MLTHLLELLCDRGLANILTFKGGTFLRKMIFGSGGRLSTDLDFTSRSETGVEPDDVLVELMIALQEPYRGLTFTLERDKDWYSNEDGCTAIPLVAHSWNSSGLRIKLQVSLRERPTLPVQEMAQIEQPYSATSSSHRRPSRASPSRR